MKNRNAWLAVLVSVMGTVASAQPGGAGGGGAGGAGGGGQPASSPGLQPVDPSQVPAHIREQFERDLQKKRESNTEPVAPGTPAAANPAEVKRIERPTPQISSENPRIIALAKMLPGSFVSEPVGDFPKLRLNVAVINLEGTSNAFYYEVARDDSPHVPFRQGVWTIWTKGDETRVRLLRFSGLNRGLERAVTGMWMAPEIFPALDIEQLDSIGDIILKQEGDTLKGGTLQPLPIMLNGAVELTSQWSVSREQIILADQGLGADGDLRFGVKDLAQAPVFKRTAAPTTATRMENGVVVYDLVQGPQSGTKLVDFGSAAVHYTGWLPDGTEFGTSYNANPRSGIIEPFQFTMPGALVPGWNMGVAGLTKGTIRRIYVPAAMGYGPRARGKIPANSDLIFNIETLFVGEPKPPEASAVPPAPAVKQPAAGAAAPGAPASNTPAGQSPANQGLTEVDPSKVPAHIREAAERDMQRRAQQQQQQQQQQPPQPSEKK